MRILSKELGHCWVRGEWSHARQFAGSLVSVRMPSLLLQQFCWPAVLWVSNNVRVAISQSTIILPNTSSGPRDYFRSWGKVITANAASALVDLEVRGEGEAAAYTGQVLEPQTRNGCPSKVPWATGAESNLFDSRIPERNTNRDIKMKSVWIESLILHYCIFRVERWGVLRWGIWNEEKYPDSNTWETKKGLDDSFGIINTQYDKWNNFNIID